VKKSMLQILRKTCIYSYLTFKCHLLTPKLLVLDVRRRASPLTLCVSMCIIVITYGTPVEEAMKNMGRPKTEEETKVQHVRFGLATLNHLEEIASSQGGRSVASVIRQIVEDYLKTQKREPNTQ
jgi:hypothetical protein